MVAEISTAKAEKIGARHGEAYARDLVRKVGPGPIYQGRLASDMQAHLERQARIYGAAGWSPEDGVAWAKAFVAAAEPILLPLVEGRPANLPVTGLAAMAERARAAATPMADNDAAPDLTREAVETSTQAAAEAEDEDGPSSPDEGKIEATAEAPCGSDDDYKRRRNFKIYFKDEAERDRFFAFYPKADFSDYWFAAGIKVAEDIFIPRLMRGELGLTRDEIYRSIHPAFKTGLRELRKSGVSRNLIWCYRQARLGRFHQEVEIFEESMKALEDATEALSLIAAGFTKAAAAMDRAAKALPPIAPSSPRPALPGLGAPLRRPLRPEDFGALPTLGRP